MRVLQIGMGWFPGDVGGVDRVFRNLTRHLVAQGVDVRGIVVSDASTDDAEFECHRIALSQSLPRRIWQVRAATRRLILEWVPEVVACHFAPYGLGMTALKALGVPVVNHFHGPWGLESRAGRGSDSEQMVKEAIERRVYRHGSRTIVLSEAFRGLVCERFGVSPGLVDVVPGGVELDKFQPREDRPALRKAYGVSASQSLLLSVRRLEPRMGLDKLLEAMPRVIAQNPETRLLIAGSGSERGALENLAVKMGLGGSVRLLGRVSDEELARLYAAADLVVLPSESLEGFGLSIVEGLACGTPALVTPVGGMPEVVQGLSADLIAADRTSEAIGTAICSLLGPDSAIPNRSVCRLYAEEHFDWTLAASRTAGVYQRVADA
jgi:glycosyltransferase involved in cell wall biosynthesis